MTGSHRSNDGGRRGPIGGWRRKGDLTFQLVASVGFLWLSVGLIRQRVSLKGDTLWAALSGLLEPGMAYAFGTFGLMLTTAGNASLIATTEPSLIAVLAWLLFREKVGVGTALAISAAMTGVAMITGAHGAGVGSPLGDGLVVLGTVFAALYVVVSSRLVSQLTPVTLAALQQSVGLVFALALLLVWSSPDEIEAEVTQANFGLFALALVSGIVQYALAFWLYLIGLKQLKASTVALFLTLTPVFGLAGAAFFLGEKVTLLQASGAMIIIVAVALASRLDRGRIG